MPNWGKPLNIWQPAPQIPRKKTSWARQYISDKSRLPKCNFSKSIWCTFQWSNPFPEWFIDSPGQYKYVAENRISIFEKLRFVRGFEICRKVFPFVKEKRKGFLFEHTTTKGFKLALIVLEHHFLQFKNIIEGPSETPPWTHAGSMVLRGLRVPYRFGT